MKTGKKLIRCTIALILLACAMLTTSCNAATGDTLTKAEKEKVASILPRIVRDLQECDLIKEQNLLLRVKVNVLTSCEADSRQRAEAVEKQAQRERRKYRTRNILRTAAEVAAIVLLIAI